MKFLLTFLLNVVIIRTARTTVIPSEYEIDAARSVIERILTTEIYERRNIVLEGITTSSRGFDVFEVSTSKNGTTTVLQVKGSSGVAITSGFYYYMRNFANGSVTWGLNRSGVHLGSFSSPNQQLPNVPEPVRVVSSSKVRYMYNFCTLSYSLAFASLEDWQFQVDWLALHGINAPLGAIGTEYVQGVMYSKLGLTEQELLDFFPGPAFLGWNRMSDMDGPWSGPLSEDWRERRAIIANVTFNQMRSIGMKVIRMGFSGHVPCSIQRLFPNASFAPRQTWQGFNSSCLLDPRDPLFSKLANLFMETQNYVFGDYGTGQMYSTDQWNEISPSSYNHTYLKSYSAAVYEAMNQFDSESVWVMQAWFLVSIALCEQGQTAYCDNGWLQENNGSSIPYPRAAAYLSGIPKGRLLLLDLEASVFPVYKYTDHFYGHDFVWSMIHNFGQKPGMYGNLTSMMNSPLEAMSTSPSNFMGIGMMMEGINQNHIIYELTAEMAWHNESFDLNKWVENFVLSRYGNAYAMSAWNLMTDSSIQGVYTQNMNNGDVVSGYIDGECDLNFENSNPKGVPGHNTTNECLVFESLLNAASSSLPSIPSTLEYDLVDSARQCLDNILWDVSRVLEGAFRRGDLNATSNLARTWFNLAETLDTLLNSNTNFMIGPWLEQAHNTAQGDAQTELLDYNARNQITLWSPKQSSLSDYARKMWGGLLSTYHVRGRWGITIEAALYSLRSNTTLNHTAINIAIAKHEIAWQTNTSQAFPIVPTSNLMDIAYHALNEYVAGVTTSSFTLIENADVDRDFDLLPQSSWTRLVGTLAFLCSSDPMCVGFNSNGVLISHRSVNGSAFSPRHDIIDRMGVNLYLSTSK